MTINSSFASQHSGFPLSLSLYPKINDPFQSNTTLSSLTTDSNIKIRECPAKTFALSEENPICDPLFFRQPQNQSTPYQFPTSHEDPVFKKEELKNLQFVLNSQDFDPWNIDQKKPIHNELLKISSRLLNQCEGKTLIEKISYLEKAIEELIVGSSSIPDPLSFYAAKLPKFELLEIALRNQLFRGLVFQEKSVIETFYELNKNFPKELDEQEAALYRFVTKNNFYLSPIPNLYFYLIEDALIPFIETLVNEATTEPSLDFSIEENEKRIKKALETLQLIKTSQCSFQFELTLREEITKKIIATLATQYKKEFQETGAIDKVKMDKDIEKLQYFNPSSNENIGKHLIEETFEFSPQDVNPFENIREKILQEQSISEKENGSWLSWFPLSFFSSTEKLPQKKLQTLQWVEENWNNSCPSAPPQDFLDPSSLETQEEINPSTIDSLPETNSPPELPKEIPMSAPTLQSTPLLKEPSKITTHEQNVPIISYVDIAFEHVFKGYDSEQWNSLPPLVQKDVLLHIYCRPSLKGKAEDVARHFFKNNGWAIQQQINNLNNSRLSIPNIHLRKDFISEGQELIDIYYSDKIVHQFANFLNRFRQLPKEPLFYQYVYEMAKAANVHIEPWDHLFAENNWDRPEILHLSVQALERCLHTAPKQ